jgi:hypothetical protein
MNREQKIQQLRDNIWKAWEEVRSARGKKKTMPIFGVEMFLLELGMAANGILEKNNKEEQQ